MASTIVTNGYFEFNNIATQVQLEIFESYFENLNQQLRQPENSSEYANRIKLLREKVNKFETSDTLTTVLGAGDLTTLATPVHRLGTLEYVNGNELPVTIQKTTRHDFNLVSRSFSVPASQSFTSCSVLRVLLLR